MSRAVRTSIVAVLVLVAGVLGVVPAHALPAGSTPLFAAGPSGTPESVWPLSHTAAGLVYSIGYGGNLYIRPTGGSPVMDDRWTYPTVHGDLISEYDYSSTVTWRTIADATRRTHTVPAGLEHLGSTVRGYVAQSGTGPYALVHVDLIGGKQATIGTAADPFYNVRPGPRGVAAETSGSSRYFPFGSNGAGQPLATPAAVTDCTLGSTHLYCETYEGTGHRLHRFPLTGAAGASVAASYPFGLAETSTGLAFTQMPDPDAEKPVRTLWHWPTTSSSAVERLPGDYGLAGATLASATAGTVLVIRDGAMGTAGIYSVPISSGTPTLVLPAPAEARVASAVAIGPGQVVWADNQRSDGAVWSRSLDGQGAPSSAERLVSSNATGTSLSVSGDRATYTAGAYSDSGLRLRDGSTDTLIHADGTTATVSGDRLLYHTQSYTDGGVDESWFLRNLRTGSVASLPDALEYDLWGERLARLNADGSVYVYDRRTGGSVQVRAATPAQVLWGTVRVAGDHVVWSVATGTYETSVTETKARNVRTLAAPVAMDDIQWVNDVSTGYAFGSVCDETAACHSVAVSLSTGQVTMFEDVYTGAIDGSVVGYTGTDGIPSVVALPAYADAPRLLAAPGAPTSLTSGRSWSMRVVASRVLSACAVEIRSSAGALARSLPCTDSNAATTVTWDGKNSTGALVPGGSYTWRIVGNTGGAALVDYDGSTAALSGTVTVSGAPTVTAQTPVVNGTSAAVGTTVTATFSEAVQGVSGTTFTLRSAGGTAVTGAVTYNATTRVATLDPSTDLAPDVKYTATLTGGTTAIRDSTNVPLATTSWTFTTGPAPTVTAVSPKVDGTSASLGGNPAAVFGEPVTGVSGTTFTLAKSNGTAVPATVTYDATARRATLNPTTNLAPDTRYTLTLTGGATAIRDAAGNPLVTKTWRFTTGPAPTVTSRTPAAGATGTATTANVTAVFSEPVQAVSGTTFRLRDPAGTVIPAVVTYDRTTRTATLDPSATLRAATVYTVDLTGGTTAIRDGMGNPLISLRWTFTTG